MNRSPSQERGVGLHKDIGWSFIAKPCETAKQKEPGIINSVVLFRKWTLYKHKNMNYLTSSDPHHDISIVCLDAIVRSMLPYSLVL